MPCVFPPRGRGRRRFRPCGCGSCRFALPSAANSGAFDERSRSVASETVVRNAGEGEAFWMLGGLYEVKTSSKETDGAMTVMEMTLPAGAGPPPHTHPGSETVGLLAGGLHLVEA